MPLPTDSPAPITSLLIVRLSAMGDIIHTLPAASLLRRAFPQATIGWVVEKRWAELLCAPHCTRSGPRSSERPLVDRIHTVETTAWRRALFSANTWREIAASISDLRAFHYDDAIDFQGAIRSAALARGAKSRLVWGDAHPREKGASVFYSQKVRVDGAGTHVVDQSAALAAALIAATRTDAATLSAPADTPVEFPADPKAEEKVAALLTSISSFAILNPGAGWGAKRWPAERYGEVARALAKEGLQSLVNYGPGEEGLANAVHSASGGTAQKVSCTISELIALTRRARLFIGGDTGPMHLAAALKVPLVAVFGPTNPARNGPFATRSIVLRNPASVTDHSRHRDPEPGLLEITADEVSVAARQLLQTSAIPMPAVKPSVAWARAAES